MFRQLSAAVLTLALLSLGSGPVRSEVARSKVVDSKAGPPEAGSTDRGILLTEYSNRFAFGLNYYALTYHPGGGGAEYPRQLDDKAFWVVQLGGEANADYYLSRYFLLRAAGSLYRDCADVWAGYAHLGFRLNWAMSRFAARIGIGPSFLWRESWLGVVDRYRADAFFGRPSPKDRFQSAWIWYGGNLEAEIKVGRGVGLVYSLVPGYPMVITSSLGLRVGF